MKFLAATLALLCAVSTTSSRTAPVGNAIDDLVREAFEYVRKEMEVHNPWKAPDIPTQHINDDRSHVYLTVSVPELYVSNATDFSVDNIENNLTELWARFGLSIPTLHVQGKYGANGTVLGHSVSGQGPFSMDLAKLVIAGFVQLDVVDHAMQMTDLEFNYTIKDLKFKEQGLVVQGISEEELEDIFTKQLLRFVQDQQRIVCERIASQVMLEANEIMKGKSLKELIEWLKNFVNPTTPSPSLS